MMHGREKSYRLHIRLTWQCGRESRDGFDEVWIALDVENSVPKFCPHGVHGFECEVLVHLFSDFVPEVLLGI